MKDYFSISQVSRSCGVSRATILRLENKGLLKPAYVDEHSGYRYYDNNNVSWIMQVQLFLGLGMNYDDIRLYHRTNGNSVELLERTEAKLATLRRAHEEIKLRVDDREAVSFEYVDLPECTCFVKEFYGTSVENSYQAMYDLYHEAIERGYRLMACEPLFLIHERDDFIRREYISDAEVHFFCCVPLDAAHAPKDATVVPACRAFSCLFHGNYSHRTEVFNIFGRKIRELNLKPTGNVRVLGLVAPYTSRDIPADKYVTRLAIPIEG